MPLSGPSAAALNAALTSSLVTSRLELDDQVGDRAVGTGTRMAQPVQLALELGQHQAVALAAPVVVGMMFMRRGAGPAQVLVREVQDDLVVGVGVDGGHQALLDAEGRRAAPWPSAPTQFVVQDALEMMWCVAGSYVVVVDAHHDRDVLVLGRARR